MTLYPKLSPSARQLGLAILALVCVSLAPSANAQGYPEPTGIEVASTYPYSMIGRVDTDTGIASATVVTSLGAVTAGHVLYDEDDGWSTGIVFDRGQYDDTYLQRSFPDGIAVLGGYVPRANAFGGDDPRTFAYDIGAMSFASPPGEGSWARIRVDPAALTGPRANTCYGYGAETHSSYDLLSVPVTRVFRQRLGQYYLNRSFYVESGMSGGPIFAPVSGRVLAVVAVAVSSADPQYGFSSGVRAIDLQAARLIRLTLN